MVDNQTDNQLGESSELASSSADKENKSSGSSEAKKRDRRVTQLPDKHRSGALEVSVDNNVEKAMKVLKRKLIKEGVFKELKLRRYYEKPSEKKKRKLKESMKKIRKDEARQRKQNMF